MCSLRCDAASRLVANMLSSGEGKEGLLVGLQQALTSDRALVLQLKALLSEGQA